MVKLIMTDIDGTLIAGDSITMVSAFLQRPRACLKNILSCSF